MKKKELKQLAEILSDEILQKPVDFDFSQWYQAALDIIDCRLFKAPPSKVKRDPPKNILHLDFKNKGIEMVNLNSILHSPDIFSTIPSSAKGFVTPTIVYSLEQPISSKIFNFNKFNTTFNVEDFLKDETVLPCSCHNSKFIDVNHKHIVTGDLRIVENNKLRKLFCKGPKYRESKIID